MSRPQCFWKQNSNTHELWLVCQVRTLQTLEQKAVMKILGSICYFTSWLTRPPVFSAFKKKFVLIYCVRVCVCACVRACVRACVCVCVCCLYFYVRSAFGFGCGFFYKGFFSLTIRIVPLVQSMNPSAPTSSRTWCPIWDSSSLEQSLLVGSGKACIWNSLHW